MARALLAARKDQRSAKNAKPKPCRYHMSLTLVEALSPHSRQSINIICSPTPGLPGSALRKAEAGALIILSSRDDAANSASGICYIARSPRN